MADRHHGRFTSGHKGGPGRPVNAITNALRRMADPEAIASYLISVVNDPKAPAKERMAAAQMILDRTEGRAVQAVKMEVQTATETRPSTDFSQLSDEELDQYLALCEKARSRGAKAEEAEFDLDEFDAADTSRKALAGGQRQLGDGK